jgi:hypothetical protein
MKKMKIKARKMQKQNNMMLYIAIAVILVVAGFFAVTKMGKPPGAQVENYVQEQVGDGESQVSEEDIDGRLNALDQNSVELDKEDQPIDVLGN